MKYYFANLSLHLLITAILIILVIVFHNRNRKRKTRHVITYFFPFILMIGTVIYCYCYSVPRLLDVKSMIEKNFYSLTGIIEEVSPLRNSVVIDGKTFYTNPLYDIPEVGTAVRIRYTEHGQYMVEIVPD